MRIRSLPNHVSVRVGFELLSEFGLAETFGDTRSTKITNRGIKTTSFYNKLPMNPKILKGPILEFRIDVRN